MLLTIIIKSYECDNSSVVTRHLNAVCITYVTAADIFSKGCCIEMMVLIFRML